MGGGGGVVVMMKKSPFFVANSPVALPEIKKRKAGGDHSKSGMVGRGGDNGDDERVIQHWFSAKWDPTINKIEKKRKAPSLLNIEQGKRKEVVTTTVKKRAKRSGVPDRVKKKVWSMYMGGHNKEGTCPLCRERKIKSTINCGFETAHIIAYKYCAENDNPYMLIPSCGTCNNRMRTTNMWTWLYQESYYKSIRHIAWIIYRAQLEEFPEKEGQLLVPLFRRLYGRSGREGGIDAIGGCAREIYQQLNQLQYNKLVEEQQRLAKLMGENTKLMSMVLDQKI